MGGGGVTLLKKITLLNFFLVLLFVVVVSVMPLGHKEKDKPVTASNIEGTLNEKMNKVLSDTRLQGATVGISIRNASDGEIIYAHFGDTRVHPASVMKLLTGASALETLGKDYQFQTELYTDGTIRGGVLDGNLYLRGQGDPTLTMADLQAFALNLKKKGIQHINGNLYGDDSWYDDVRLSQDLNWSDEPYYTGAQVSALTLSPNKDYDAGTVIVEVSPAAKKGQSGSVRMVPANDYIKVVNRTQTVAKNGSNSIEVKRVHGENTMVVTGTIPVGAAKTRTWASVWEPTDYTVDLFNKAIEEQGIQFAIAPELTRAKVPDGATLLTAKESISLEELFIPFMKLSNNGHGEVFVKEMGRVVDGVGSWDKGLEVMDRTLATLGIDTTKMLLRDGSGMSHKNLVTANEVTHLLFTVQAKPWYPTFLNALPVAGHDKRFVGGTLRNRMKGTSAEGKVQAKTGLLNGVSALSGYVETKGGETLIFSVLVNNHLDDKIPEVLDQVAVTLANYTLNE